MKTLRLVVTRIAHEAQGIVSIEFRSPIGNQLPAWDPGAHIDIRLPSGKVRQYSLCSDPEDLTCYRVAVLRVSDGRGGSVELHDTVRVGQELEIAGPRNHFPLVPTAAEYLLIAGGIGVTPLLTMARQLARERRSWSMIYGGRSRATMAYLEELTELSERIEIVPEVERGIPDLATALAAAPAGTAVYCCGPEAMISATRKLCSDHLKDGELYIERFGAAKKDDDPLPDSSTGTGGEITVELVRSGLILQIPADRSILDVILKALPGTRYSCGEGYCGACEVKVLEGTPDHRDDILTDEERLTGDSMMICVSRAESPTLKLDL